MKKALDWILDWLKTEPAVASLILSTAITLAAKFGFEMDDSSVFLLYAVLNAMGYAVTRQSVTPTAKL